jgi:hypothetical protein
MSQAKSKHSSKAKSGSAKSKKSENENFLSRKRNISFKSESNMITG